MRSTCQAGNKFIAADAAKKRVVATFVANATDLTAMLVMARVEQGFVREAQQFAGDAIVKTAGIGTSATEVAAIANQQAVAGK